MLSSGAGLLVRTESGSWGFGSDTMRTEAETRVGSVQMQQANKFPFVQSRVKLKPQKAGSLSWSRGRLALAGGLCCQQRAQILAIAGFAESLNLSFELLRRDPTILETDLFQAGYL